HVGGRPLEGRGAHVATLRLIERSGDVVADRPGVLGDLVALLAVDARYLPQHRRESRPSEVVLLRREIRAAVEHLALLREERGGLGDEESGHRGTSTSWSFPDTSPPSASPARPRRPGCPRRCRTWDCDAARPSARAARNRRTRTRRGRSRESTTCPPLPWSGSRRSHAPA